MKKVFALVLTLCLLATSVALAGFDAPELVLEGTTWKLMSSVNRLQANPNYEGYMLYDMQGNVLSGKYEMILDSLGGTFMPVEVKGGEFGLNGVINPDGVEVVPPEFDNITVNGSWAIAMLYGEGTEEDCDVKIRIINSDGEVRYKTFDIVALYYLPTGDCVQIFEDRSFYDWSVQNDYVNICDKDKKVTSYGPDGAKLDISTGLYNFSYVPAAPVPKAKYDSESGRNALVDADGNPLTDSIYDSISTYGFERGSNYCEMEKDDRKGLLNLSGEEVIPAAYDKIERVYSSDIYDYQLNGVFCGVNGDVLTLITPNGNVDVQLDGCDYNFYGSFVIVKRDNSKELVLANGNVIDLGDARANTSYVGGKMWLRVDNDSEGTATLMDDQGNVVFTVKGNISMSQDGHVLVYDSDAKQYAVYTID